MTDVYVEVGRKKVFACALEWPGWGRAGKDESEALAALVAYDRRYAAVAKRAGVPLPPGSSTVSVVARVVGGATTDFGAPGEIAPSDCSPADADEARTLCSLMQASWAAFDAAASVAPAELRKGPRGGGRDLDKICAHVLEADSAYARKIGVKLSKQQLAEEGFAVLRREVLAVLDKGSDGKPLTPRGWPVRYAVRRFAWHALDHAWEMEDRSA